MTQAQGGRMTGYFFLFKTVFRWILCLALTGEIVSCTLEIKKNAHESVSHGLVNLRALNNHLMNKPSSK